MPVIQYEVYIEAPIELCFDLARDIDIHMKTTAKTKEKAIAGVTSGYIEEGQTVTWEAVHLGVKQRLTAKISQMDRPHIFTDVMVKGAFHSFTHTHEFVQKGTGTVMKDTFIYTSPLGILGKLADKLFLERYMRNFIVTRVDALKKYAEEQQLVRK